MILNCFVRWRTNDCCVTLKQMIDFRVDLYLWSISTRDNRATMDELERSDRERSKLVEWTWFVDKHPIFVLFHFGVIEGKIIRGKLSLRFLKNVKKCGRLCTCRSANVEMGLAQSFGRWSRTSMAWHRTEIFKGNPIFNRNDWTCISWKGQVSFEYLQVNRAFYAEKRYFSPLFSR